VPAADGDRLPTMKVKRDGKATEQLDKSAFVYDAERNCYWHPTGQPLEHKHTTTERNGTGQRIRNRYYAEAQAVPVAR
jgi:hypothetical protein